MVFFQELNCSFVTENIIMNYFIKYIKFIKAFIIFRYLRIVLFECIIAGSSESYPHFGLKWIISFSHIRNRLKFVFALFAYEDSLCLPDWFLLFFRNEFENHICYLFT